MRSATEIYSRKTPEELLHECRQDVPDSNRGRLKVFLGYASGVGKSQRMFLEALRRRERGQNVVVAGLQPHIPSELMAVLRKLPTVPTRNVAGVEVIDVEALLEQKPAICVIDGLAYNNPPGSRNATRWQDARTLLESGISVIGSVNVQYIAELRSQVEPLTGKSVLETIPLEFLKTADEIEIVDAPAEDSRSLSKLREIALVVAADVVDIQLADYLRTHGIDQQAGAQERILICVTPRSNLKDMLATARLIADRFHGRITVAYVRQPHLSAGARQVLEEKLTAARAAGAHVAELQGENFVDTLLEFARQQQITQLFIGHTQRHGFRSRFFGNPVEKLIRDSQGMDIRIFPQ